ncbi:MAG: SPOR domain-containing protein [Bacteroidales bacterium]|nr:SPOR domain-containing protein [Bacteroidales bacterium]
MIRSESQKILNLKKKLLLHYILLIWAFTGLSFIFPQNILAQEPDEFYEISVNLEVNRIGGAEIEAVIKGKDIYLSINQLFDFIKINNTLSPNITFVEGFFIEKAQPYKINRIDNEITFGNRTIKLNEGDLIRTEFDLYLKSEYFGSVFGLNCIFNFRSLSVKVETQLDLPLIREMRQLEIRKNLSRITGKQDADTTFEREYPMFKFGTADWSVISNQEIGGKTDARLNMTLGAMIAGGEATASLNYDSRIPLSEKQQYYQWRYVNNDQSLLRQVKLGKIRTGSVSTIFNPVVGVQLTNTPTTFRRSFGTYKISDRTEPGWVVELYVNNVLVDYKTADASGFFSFDVPLVYGNTSVQLKFFGPWGEESSREQNINIPFNFLPKNELEYTMSAGFIEDSTFSKFGRAEVNYGATNRLTFGAGLEYVSYINSAPAMPFVSTSLRASNNLMISGEYIHNVKAGGALSLRLPSNIIFDIKYNKYEKDQEAINYNYLEERKATLSIPLRIKNFAAYNRFSINQLILPLSKYTSGEWMFAASLWGVNTNLSTYAIFIEETDPYIYNNLSLAFRLPARITIMPQAQYSISAKELLSAKLRVEKHLGNNAYINISYEKDFRSNTDMAEFGFRYNFAFAQTGFTARQSHNKTTLVEYARGSLINDSKNSYFKAENKPNIGKGGIIVKAFLDYNTNGERDPGEPAAPGLNLRANGGRIDKSEKDTTIAILGLEPYTSCFIELDQNSFDNIAWILKYKTISVEVDPNVMKTVNIPVQVVGEASGFIRIARGDEQRGLSRIIVNFFREDGRKIYTTLSESDGYYGHFGLAPGNYYVKPDTAQLNNLGMTGNPASISFNIKTIIEGDLISGLDFLLNEKPADTIQTDTTITGSQVVKAPVTRRDTSYMIVHEVVEELLTITEDSWAIQLGAFSVKSNAERLKKKLETMLGKQAEIVIEGGFHKVRILDLKDREEVDSNLVILNEHGFNEFWVVRLKAMQQQLVMREVSDTLTTIVETVINPDSPEAIGLMSIKIGSFKNEALARAILNKLSITLDKELSIIKEAGYFRIKVSGFSSPEDLDRTILAMGIQGIRDVRISAEEAFQPEIIKDTVLVDTLANKEIITERSERFVIDSLKVREADIQTKDLVTDLEKDRMKMQEPKVSLLVGRFSKRTQALKAKRKIESRLNLPVEIIEQWDLYRVVVIGFFTIEETYSWYPELAGIGYDVISIIDESEK